MIDLDPAISYRCTTTWVKNFRANLVDMSFVTLFIQKIKDNAAQLTIPQSVQQVDETPIKLKVSSGSQDIDINLDDYK